MSKGKLIFKNIFYGAGTRLVILALGMILPRLFITSFGSEMNGLLSTTTQIFTYLALVEAGIGNSTINALYKPLDDKNYSEANSIMCEARAYYRRVSLLYGAGIIAFSIIYPLLANSSISKWTIFGIVALQGAANFVGYYFTAVYSQLLAADGKKYISENVTFVSSVLINLIKIVMIMLGLNVIMVQLGHLIINVLKIPVLSFICKRKYSWLDFSQQASKGKLKERGAFIIHEASGTIFNNTDVFIISVFCSFEMASVYTVYNMVFSALTSLMSTANSGLGFIFGQNQYKGRERLVKIYDVYSTVYSMVAFIVFTVSAVLIVPFVKLYTNGVSDVNYLMVGLPILFTVINLMSSVRMVAVSLITVSGHADTTKRRSMAEAMINLVSSLILVNIFGIYGVLLGTIFALIYRANDLIIYANRKILNRNPLYEYKSIIIYSVVFAIIWIAFKYITLDIDSYLAFAGYGIFITLIVAVIYMVVTLITKPLLIREAKYVIGRVFRTNKAQ